MDSVEELHKLVGGLGNLKGGESIFVKVSYEYQDKTDPFRRWKTGHKTFTINNKQNG